MLENILITIRVVFQHVKTSHLFVICSMKIKIILGIG